MCTISDDSNEVPINKYSRNQNLLLDLGTVVFSPLLLMFYPIINVILGTHCLEIMSKW